MSRVVVTGGAGFIGSHTVERLVAEGYEVTVLDDLSTGREENLAGVRDAIDLVVADVCDPQAVRRAIEGAHAVIHLAALPSVPRSLKDPRETTRVNVLGTVTVLEAAVAQGVRRVVYASSSSVYGPRASLPNREDAPPDPASPYAVSKLAGEQYVQVFGSLFPLETVCLRYFNVFGPRQREDSPYAGVVPRFIGQALRGEPYTIHGDGQQRRDFTYVENAVQANLAALRAPVIAGTVLNVACGESTSVLDLARGIDAALGVKEPRRTHLPPRPGDIRNSQASIDRARELLGYVPAVTVEEGLRRTVQAMLAHVRAASPDGLKNPPRPAGERA